jgi:hypothetical protein
MTNGDLLGRIMRWTALVTSGTAAAVILFNVAEWTGVRPVVSSELADVREQVAANTTSLKLQRWQHLDAKRRSTGLDVTERREYCLLSRALGFRGEGCA